MERYSWSEAKARSSSDKLIVFGHYSDVFGVVVNECLDGRGWS
jgi:hypothetical protein